jgi:hypothetical protein
MKALIKDNVTILVVRRHYFQKTRSTNQVVGALTFSRLHVGQPVYLAYMAVSDGKHKLPSVTQTNVCFMPWNIFGERSADDVAQYTGYQSFGVETLILVLMGNMMKSVRPSKRTPPSGVYLHFNKDNTGLLEGWTASGFCLFDAPTWSNPDAICLHYDQLAKNLKGCAVFEACYNDETNYVPMCSLTPGEAPSNMSDEWFVTFDGGLQKKYRSTAVPPPLHDLSNGEMKAKYKGRTKTGDVKVPEKLSLYKILCDALERKNVNLLQSSQPNTPEMPEAILRTYNPKCQKAF